MNYAVLYEICTIKIHRHTLMKCSRNIKHLNDHDFFTFCLGAADIENFLLILVVTQEEE